MGKLEILNLNQSFRKDDGSDLVVLDKISFEVADKEFVCILGSSGCGKTTLLRLIAGLDEAQSGSIVLDGEEIRGTSPKVGMVFQEYSLFPWRTVIDNIAFGLEMRGMPRDERYRIADHYLQLVNLLPQARYLLFSLSSICSSLLRCLVTDFDGFFFNLSSGFFTRLRCKK